MMIGTGLYINFGTRTSVAMVIGLEIIGDFGPTLLFQGLWLLFRTLLARSILRERQRL
jgi:hypothetical protein